MCSLAAYVSAPNLLADRDAFENWDLFGRPVRVETAAEIVAKKMFHRGDKATARDLFDLALVVEREPATLLKAEPFMYRHLDIFAAHLQEPSAGYIRQFEGVDTTGYQPSFAHASEVALGYINGLRTKLEKSQNEALAMAAADGLSVGVTDVESGKYFGPMLHNTSHHVIQHIGRGAAAVHEKHRLPGSLQDRPLDKRSFDLRYRNGLAHALSKARDVGIER